MILSAPIVTHSETYNFFCGGGGGGWSLGYLVYRMRSSPPCNKGAMRRRLPQVCFLRGRHLALLIDPFV